MIQGFDSPLQRKVRAESHVGLHPGIRSTEATVVTRVCYLRDMQPQSSVQEGIMMQGGQGRRDHTAFTYLQGDRRITPFPIHHIKRGCRLSFIFLRLPAFCVVLGDPMTAGDQNASHLSTSYSAQKAQLCRRPGRGVR